ncbi:T9SS type A sorting domain-containing protein [Roseivirga sp.]|uniref:T9SS type A sorting domain-containing protein n=1 Tax=Roseivirga sp. TaxID=1964215 RepID=UPI003B8C56EB
MTCFGQTPIASASFSTTTTGLTTSSYTVSSPSDASGGILASTSYLVRYGEVQNQFITDYTVGGTLYDNFVLPDTLIIRRTDAGRQLIIFYEYDRTETGPTPDEIFLDPEQQDNEEGLYLSGLSNAGYDNILTNNSTNFANVERIDILYYTGVVTSSPTTAVFPIIERGGNDDIRVAAVRGLDANGDPNDYYPTVVRVSNDGTTDWGNLGQSHISLVMRRQDATSNPIPVQVLGSQNIHGSAIAFDEFGIAADDIVYGYSIFADDVTVTGSDLVDFTNSTNYPTGTTGSGLDLIAGVSTAVASDNNLTKSVGPGGYKAALNTWLKANNDESVTTSTDGSTVTDWQDEWLGDHDATTLTTAPTYRDGSASNLDDINFNPTVDFLDAAERGLQIANNTDFNTATSYTTKGINIAIRTGNDVTVKQQIYEQGSNDRGINVYIRNGDLYVGAWNIPNTDGTGDNWGFSSTSTSISTDTEYIVTLEFNGNSGGTGTVAAYLNGENFGTISSVGLLFNDTDGIGLGDTNSQSRYDDGTTAAASFYGSIPEFVYCNEPGSFPTTQRNRIESYLALKYGITLDQSSPINYVNSDGSTIFNTTTAAAIGGYLEYNNDIAGIGRDDNSELEQLSSQSENTGSLVQIDRNSAIGSDDTWLIWGNDGGLSSSSRLVTKPDAINERIERIWRVAEENSVGVTDVSFDLTGLGYTTDTNDFALMIASNSSNGDFSSATLVTGGTFNGDVITFPDVELSDGQYFTLGTQFFICTPGNVQDGLSLWLKADAETFNTGTTAATDGQTVETWGDQSRNDFDATNDGGVTNRAPTWVETDLNFNPGLNWDAGTNEIGFTLGSNFIFAPAANGGSHIFSSIEPETTFTGGDRNNKWIYNFGNNNNSAVGIAGYGDRANIVADGKVNFNISPNNTSYLAEGDFNTNSGTGDTKNYIIDGTIVSTNTGVDIDIDDSGITQNNTHASNQGPVSIGRQSETNNLGNNGGRRFFGDMQEVIVYNENVSDLEAQQIRSYLAIKYGTTLTNDNDADATPNETLGGAVVEGDYVASDGTTITFDYSDDTGFVTNVAGIGRDDDTCLEQKQSSSVNTGSILTIGLGEIAANNAANSNSFDDDLDFLTWGSDGASTDFGSITTAGTPGTVTERMLRIWRAQDTGDVGLTDISFDLTGLPGYSTDETDYQLIIASGGDNTSLESGSTIVGGTFNGTVLTFENIDLTDGQYFTLGVSKSQCSPGGVPDANLQIWLRADLGISTSGSDVTGWSDQSGKANNASSTSEPELNTNNHNFNPSVDFTAINSDNMEIADASNLSPDQQAVFLVGTINSGSDAWSPFIIKTATFDWPDGWGIARNNSTTEILYHKDNYTDNTSGADYASRTIVYNTPNIHTAYKDATDYYYSLDLGTEDTDTPNSTYQSSDNIIFLGATPDGTGTTNNTTATNFLEGSISEVAMFSDDLTATQRQQVATYLAVKYGITLEANYLWSDGTTELWNITTNATYSNDIAGIGRDDISCFSQKQSSSVNDGSILTIGLESVENTNAENLNSFSDDGDYLVWGHDGVATDQATAAGDLTDLPSTVSERMRRVWRVEDTGTVGETEIQFDLTGLGYSTSDASDYRLIIADAGSGGTMAGGTLVAGGTFNGDVLSFTGIDLTDGQYFTLGTALETCGPGGVNSSIGLWLRGDLEVFSDAGSTPAVDGDNVQQWNDQSSPSTNASEANGGGGATVPPVFRTEEINFNPSLFISDQNTTNNSYMETAAASNNVSDDMTLIAVFETAQNQGTDNAIDNSPSLIGAEDDGGSNDYGLGMHDGEVVFNAANTNTFTARSPTATYNDSEPYIATGTRIQAASGAVNLYINSLNVASGTSDATTLDAADTWAIGNQSSYQNGAQFQGNIAEVLVFSSVLDGEELARAESYLAIKYGITRTDDNDDDMTTNEIISGSIREGDYVAADGDIIWDYAARSATYFNDIAGIGRDDLSCLDQVRSKSENDDAIVDIAISSWDNNDSWFIWGNDNAELEATRNRERPDGINSRLNREWQAQETGTVGTVSVTFDLDDVTGTPTGDNNLNLVRMMVSTNDDFSTGVTLIEPTAIDAVNNTVTFDYDFTSGEGFYYTLGSIENDALPIQLIEFKAEAKSSNVALSWSTASEENNAFYSIERSADGIEYEVIARLDGAGTSDGLNEYSFTDQSPLKGLSYYRLKQTDVGGASSYSPVESVFISAEESLKVVVMPNPVSVSQEVKLKIDLPEGTKEVNLYVFNSQGSRVLNASLSIENNLHSFSTDHLKSGIYFIKIQVDKRKALTKRLIIK